MLYNFFSGEICEEDEGISFRKFLEMVKNLLTLALQLSQGRSEKYS
jgi:hypothetical protein